MDESDDDCVIVMEQIVKRGFKVVKTENGIEFEFVPLEHSPTSRPALPRKENRCSKLEKLARRTIKKNKLVPHPSDVRRAMREKKGQKLASFPPPIVVDSSMEGDKSVEGREIKEGSDASRKPSDGDIGAEDSGVCVISGNDEEEKEENRRERNERKAARREKKKRREKGQEEMERREAEKKKNESRSDRHLNRREKRDDVIQKPSRRYRRKTERDDEEENVPSRYSRHRNFSSSSSSRYSFSSSSSSSTRRSSLLPAFNSDAVRRIALNSDPDTTADSFSLASLLGDNGKDLILRKVAVASSCRATSPLGVAFDTHMRVWMYTDTANGEVVVASYNGTVVDRIKGFKHPSAIAVVTPGALFAVLHDRGITVVDVLKNTKRDVTDDFHGNYRGLAVVEGGDLVSILYHPSAHDRGRQEFHVFSIHGKNKIISSFAYSPRNNIGRGPCFVCSRGPTIYVTDLATNRLSSFNYSAATRRIEAVSRREASSRGRSTSLLCAKFMSGAVADANHNLLVCDAQGRSVNWVTADGSLVQNLPCIERTLPYMAGIALSPTGRIALCCRRANMMQYYDIVSREKEEEDALVSGMKSLMPLGKTIVPKMPMHY